MHLSAESVAKRWSGSWQHALLLAWKPHAEGVRTELPSLLFWSNEDGVACSASIQHLSGRAGLRVPQPGLGRQDSHERLVGARQPGL